MKFITNLIKIASIPNHLKKHYFKNEEGYWITNQLGHKLFISTKTNRIFLPVALRGKFPDKVLPSEFNSIPPEESGEAFYQEWLNDFKKEKSKNDIYNGYEFTENGKKYLERLKKFFIKYKLDQQGIDLQSFDKMLNSKDIDKIKQIAKNLGKKYRLISEKLKQENNPDVEIMDKNFNNNWSKLMPLFDYEPNEYNPKIETPEDIHKKETEKDFSTFLSKVRPILDVQMNDIDNILVILAKAIKDGKMEVAQKSWRWMNEILVKNVKNYYFHPVGKNSAYILELPEFKKMHEDLFHGVDKKD